MKRYLMGLLLAGCTALPAPVPTPSASPGPTATATPQPTQTVAAARLTHGALYDALRQPIKQPATVRIVATDPGVGFTSSVYTSDGTWSLPDVPAGKLEVSVTIAGWPVRIRRLEALTFSNPAFSGAADDGSMRVINFGGPYDPKHELDQYYYLAPEIPAQAGGTDQVWPLITPGATPSCNYAPEPASAIGLMTGTVYDGDGKPVTTPVVVKINSTSASAPYTASTTAENGQWVINNVPRGADVVIDVMADGYEPRNRVVTGWAKPKVYEPYPSCKVMDPSRYRFNFGGPATPEDPEAPAYALQPAMMSSPPP